MSLDHLAGFGAARAVVMGVMKQPDNQYARSRLGLGEGSEKWIALKMEIEGLDDKELHNSETMREVPILLECRSAIHRSAVMKNCFVEPVKCLSTTSGG
jgi:hypothetical protein